MSTSDDPRSLMVEIAQLMYGRHLTNSAGGNISCRVGDRIYITPRYMASRRRWQLTPDLVLVFDDAFQPVAGDPSRKSRESAMHFACYRRFPQINGIIHAHSRYLSVFAAKGKPVEPTNEYTEKFGTTPVVPALPSHSQELARAVVEALEPHEATLEKNGLGLILTWHGALAVGRDLADAYDTLERLEWSAHTQLMMTRLPD